VGDGSAFARRRPPVLRRTFVGREQAERAAREVRRERTVRSMLKLTAALALAGFAAACAAFFGARG
jgi:hypothetical protein